MKNDNPHLIIIQAMRNGGDVSILRRAQHHMLEAFRVSTGILFTAFYQAAKDNHHEVKYEATYRSIVRSDSPADE